MKEKYGNFKESVAQLFVEMMRYYAVTFDLNRYVVCIRRFKLLSREEKKWNSKKLAVEGELIDILQIFLPSDLNI